MSRGYGHSHYDLDLETSGALVGVPDDPEPPLDIDVSPIPGEALREWRTRQVCEEALHGYPPQTRMASEVGVSQRVWSRWERQEVPAQWGAILREWMRSGRAFEIPYRRASFGEIAAICELIPPYDRCARVLGVTPSTMRGWLRGGPNRETGAPRTTGSGPLIAWLCQDLGLDPRDDLTWPDLRKVGRLDDEKVREIRARHDDGESYREIADDYRVTSTTILYVVNGDTWAHIENEGGQ